MGEYAKFDGGVKIGTCENMYYLRAGQAHLVTALPGNVDPVKDRGEIRFRFPFPDEDKIAPGRFEKYDRGVALDLPVPDSVEHTIVQFTAPGYNTCLPCPESAAAKDLGLKIHRNGHPGRVIIKQQRWIGEALVLIAECGGCGSAWREPTLEDARPYIAACLAEAERHTLRRSAESSVTWWREVAQRIEAGYKGEVF